MIIPLFKIWFARETTKELVTKDLQKINRHTRKCCSESEVFSASSASSSFFSNKKIQRVSDVRRRLQVFVLANIGQYGSPATFCPASLLATSKT